MLVTYAILNQCTSFNYLTIEFNHYNIAVPSLASIIATQAALLCILYMRLSD